MSLVTVTVTVTVTVNLFEWLLTRVLHSLYRKREREPDVEGHDHADCYGHARAILKLKFYLSNKSQTAKPASSSRSSCLHAARSSRHLISLAAQGLRRGRH